MYLVSRFRLLAQAKTRAVLDHLEEPPEVLDHAYEQQQGVLLAVRRGLVEVSTARHLLLRQLEAIREQAPRLETQAVRALGHGREDLARQLLERKHRALAEVEGLERQLAEMRAEEGRLSTAQQRLVGCVEEFRAHRDVTSARWSAAKAKVAAAEALAGMSGELGELGLAVGRAEEKTERMVARAGALQGLLEDATLGSRRLGADPVEAELRDLEIGRAVEDDLSALRGTEVAES